MCQLTRELSVASMPNRDITRKDYKLESLDEESAGTDPFALFMDWFGRAHKSGMEEPNAMVLSTVGADGSPNSRVLLLKDFSENGFIFYSNYESTKGKELASNNNAAALFYWPDLEKQIRIRGEVEKLSSKVSDDYFASRPRGAQIAAATSSQSSTIESRGVLETSWKSFESSHREIDIVRPAHWGGYILKPKNFEFWQGRDNRLHDRLEFYQEGDVWAVRRLAP